MIKDDKSQKNESTAIESNDIRSACASSKADLNDHESHKKLIIMITRMFDHWQLSVEDQLNLLGLSPNSRSILKRYRTGKSAPSSPDKLDRIALLLNIHKSLRILYPENPELCYRWVHKKNKSLENECPLNVMKNERIIGIYRISRFLDRLVDL